MTQDEYEGFFADEPVTFGAHADRDGSEQPKCIAAGCDEPELHAFVKVDGDRIVHLDPRDDLAAVERERDELAERLSALLCDLTGGRLSKPTYDVPTMVQEIEQFMGEQLEADAEARAEKAEATLARVEDAISEHPHCIGECVCAVEAVRAALEGGDDAA